MYLIQYFSERRYYSINIKLLFNKSFFILVLDMFSTFSLNFFSDIKVSIFGNLISKYNIN